MSGDLSLLASAIRGSACRADQVAHDAAVLKLTDVLILMKELQDGNLSQLARAVRASGRRADHVAADAAVVTVTDVLILIDDQQAGRLRLMDGDVVSEYEHVIVVRSRHDGV